MPHFMPRERQVLDLLMEGDTDKEIARKLTIAVPTAKQYVEAVVKKLGVKNRTAAAVWAARNLVEA